MKIMLNKEHHKRVLNWTRSNLARVFKKQSVQTVSSPSQGTARRLQSATCTSLRWAARQLVCKPARR